MFIRRNCHQSGYLFVYLSLWLFVGSFYSDTYGFICSDLQIFLLLYHCYSCCLWPSPAMWCEHLRNMMTVEIISSAVLNASVISQPWVIGSVSVINAIFN